MNDSVHQIFKEYIQAYTLQNIHLKDFPNFQDCAWTQCKGGMFHTWFRLWHMDNGAAVWTLAGDRDYAHSLGGHRDVCQRRSNNCCRRRGHWHPTVQYHCQIRGKTVNKALLLRRILQHISPNDDRVVSCVVSVMCSYHLSWPELYQWFQQACRLLR